MKSHKIFLVPSLLMALALSSCSGLPKGSGTGGCTTSCAGGGNALLNMIVTATPSTKFSVLRFAVHVTGLGVTNAAGLFIPEIGSPLTLVSEGYRLQTESQFITKANIAGDNYKSVRVTIGDGTSSLATGIFANASASTVLGCPVAALSCASGSVSCPPPSGGLSLCILPQLPTQISVDVPFIFTVIPAQNIGLDVNLNLDAAMTAQKVDFTLPGAVTVSLLPRAGQAAGSIDSLEDFTGQVSSTSGGNIITVDAKPVQEPRDFTTSSSTTFNDPFATCVTPNFACAVFSQTASVDGLIKSDGFTFPATEVDFLDKASNPHQAEGIVTSVSTTTPGQFQVLLTNFLGGDLDINNPLQPGDIVTISLNASPTIVIDTKHLLLNGGTGFSSESDILVGQVVMARVQTQTGTLPNVTLHGDRVVLRYSHINGTVASISGNNFTLTLATLPGFLQLPSTDPTVETQAGVTTFDGIGDITGLKTGDKVSIRTLYLNPTAINPFFIAAKVRKNF